MGQSRIPFGRALGREGNFQSRTDNLFTESDTTPDVTFGSLFFENNTSATVITHFDLSSPSTAGTFWSQFEGKLIDVYFLGGSTTIANAGQIRLAGTDNLFLPDQTLSLVYHNSSWIEVARSRNTRSEVTTFTVAGASVSLNVNDVSLAIINATAATTIVSLSGGQVGQQVTLVRAPLTSGTGITIDATGNLSFAGTASFVMTSGGGATRAYTFVRVDSNWALTSPVGIP